MLDPPGPQGSGQWQDMGSLTPPTWSPLRNAEGEAGGRRGQGLGGEVRGWGPSSCPTGAEVPRPRLLVPSDHSYATQPWRLGISRWAGWALNSRIRAAVGVGLQVSRLHAYETHPDNCLTTLW